MKTTLVERNAHSLRLLLLAIAAPWALGCALWLACSSAHASTVYTFAGPHFSGSLEVDGSTFQLQSNIGNATGTVHDSFSALMNDNPCLLWGFDATAIWANNSADVMPLAWSERDHLVAAVPEPESWALMLAGFALVASRRLRAGWRWYVKATRTPLPPEALEL